MPDERCEIALLKQELREFKEVCNDRWDREDSYLIEFKKKLDDVSHDLQEVMLTQSKQVNFVAGVAAATTMIAGGAWAIFTYFFSK
jgi:hypothetical protein